MLVNKIFDVILNITSINDIFNNDINSRLIKLIEQKYKNKCFLNSYILNINKIINRSLLECNQNDLNCSFNLSIQFEATCIIFIKNEVILDMQVSEIINNNMILKNIPNSIHIISPEYKLNSIIIALIKQNNDTKLFKKDDIIPIVVGKVKYTLGSDKITINAYPFIPIVEPSMNYFISKLKNQHIELLNEGIISQILVEEKIKTEINSKKNNTWKYFNNLINTDKIIKTSTNTILIKDLINKLNTLDNTIISIKSTSEGIVNILNTDSNDNYIKIDPYLSIYEILKKYYLYLKLINQLSIKYNSETVINTPLNKNIFDLYVKYKHE